MNNLQFAYSIDSVCWSCWMSYNDLLTNTINLNTDFYIKVKIPGSISKIEIDGQPFLNYSTQLDSAFSFSYCETFGNGLPLKI